MKNILLVLGILTLASPLRAQLAPINPNAIAIDMVPNSKDPTIAPAFFISKEMVTPEEYCAFLNATASYSDPHHLYHPEWNDYRNYPNLLCIARSGDSVNGYTYTLVNEETNIPVIDLNPITKAPELTQKLLPKREIMKGVPMADACRFCNWMFHDQSRGSQGDGTTETGSYTFCEVNDQGTNGPILLIQQDPKDTSNRELKNVYKSVTRTANATWRLPSRAELTDAINSWGNLDIVEILWCWTDDIYDHCWTTRIAGAPLIFNGAGYYRIKNSPVVFTDRTKLALYQNLFVSDTGFRVVFSSDKIPASGFRVFLPTHSEPITQQPPTQQNNE